MEEYIADSSSVDWKVYDQGDGKQLKVRVLLGVSSARMSSRGR